MRVSAYILAADPDWVEYSVKSYYNIVDKIVISYDQNGQGWTGAPVNTDRCLRRLRVIDIEKKMRFLPGAYTENGHSPINGETRQRQEAFNFASVDADWVLQLDADEIMPNPELLLTLLKKAAEAGFRSVEWPMRVLFRKLAKDQFLEVCTRQRQDHFEYPGPIALQSGSEFVNARRTNGPFLRLCAHGDKRSLQLSQAAQEGETRWECLEPEDAIIHNSWGRDASSIRSKIASWGHHEGWKTWLFYYCRWKPAPLLWFFMRNFHPLYPPLWPALKPCKVLPKYLVA